VNHESHVAQHFMILKALENGVGEVRLADALSVEMGNIRKKRDLLKGICPEAKVRVFIGAMNIFYNFLGIKEHD
jgi:hypothetical protein